MAQPSVANYFNTRKRCAADEVNVARAKKVLILDNDADRDLKGQQHLKNANKIANNPNPYSKITPVRRVKLVDPASGGRSKVVTNLNFEALTPSQPKMTKKAPTSQPRSKMKDVHNQGDIQRLIINMQNKETVVVSNNRQIYTPKNTNEIVHRTPPGTPTKSTNAMDKVVLTGNEMSLNELKLKLTRSSRLAELKASISKFKHSSGKLEEIEKKTSVIQTAKSASPGLKTFKTIELEVPLSPQKTPSKAYLSPKKELSSTARKNLLGLLSPTKPADIIVPASPVKQNLLSLEKSTLTLPYKYRTLAEMFKSIDTVCKMLHNRKESITFRKLKPAVEEMVRRNITESHLEQIKNLYPEAFTFRREKQRIYGALGKQEQYELVIVPLLLDANNDGLMSLNCLMRRQRHMYKVLIDKLKVYHEEFLLSMDTPLTIPKDKITRWHPEFDIERVPDVEKSALPPVPDEEKMTTGQEVLEKARTLFSCNTRMERALEKFKEMQEIEKQSQNNQTELVPKEEPNTSSLLKGIPKSLLEKVRARQAAKALETMTMSADKEKEITLYSRLPELARLTRNTFVAEKKGVLQLDFVLEKLGNSFRTYLAHADLENHLKVLSAAVPGWMVFHEIRGTVFVKLSKNADLNLVLRKLEKELEEKRSA